MCIITHNTVIIREILFIIDFSDFSGQKNHQNFRFCNKRF